MFSARKCATVLMLIGACLLLAAPAPADWDIGDGHKMHFPQLPDEDGWDVRFHDWELADDWTCSKTGPVSDIHFWVSYQDSNTTEPPNTPGFTVRIYSDNPIGPDGYSIPSANLWNRSFASADYTIRHAGTDGTVEEGWFDPSTGVGTHPDHTEYFQINIDNISDPFEQTKDEVYWLSIQMDELLTPEIGWKTADIDKYPEPYTGDHYKDDAVWWSSDGGGKWKELRDPITDESLDFAFVITIPEPSTVAMLLGAGLLGLLVFARRWRK